MPKEKKNKKTKIRMKNKPLLSKGFKKTLIESSQLSSDFCWPVEYLTLQRRENTLSSTHQIIHGTSAVNGNEKSIHFLVS